MPIDDATGLARILARDRTVAIVGLSATSHRPSFVVARYLQSHGYRIVPVNPRHRGETILDETVYGALEDIPFPVDMVDVFRRSEEVVPIAAGAVAIGARTLWQQIGVANGEADRMVRDAGLDSVMDRCTKIEHGRLMTGVDASTAAGTAPLLQQRDERGVVTLTMNRPEAFNALSEAMLAALHDAIRDAGRDEATRAIVLAATGRAFCAGHDLKQMRADPSAQYYERLFAQCGRLMMCIQQVPVPVIAQVEGIATAAGCQLVAMCDLAVASDEARFAVSGVNLGLFCSTPAVPLSRNVPRKVAFEMLVTGDFVGADAALRHGLVNRVAPVGEVAAEVERLVASIVAKPAVTVRTGKALFYRQLEQPIESAYELAARTMACNMMDEAALEGVQAFIDKRPPSWQGG